MIRAWRGIPGRFRNIAYAGLVGLLSAGELLHAQTTQPLFTPTSHSLRQWTTEDGLPQNSVNAITQTPDGYLWVGTFGGLARFDGIEFTRVERVDARGRHADRVLALTVTPDSSLWMGTEDGLFRYHNGIFTVFPDADQLPDRGIRALFAARDGALWVGTERGGALRYRDGQSTVFQTADGIDFDQVVRIVEDAAGGIWLNGSHVVRVVGDTARLARPPRLDAEHLLLIDPRGASWYRVPNGVLRVRGGEPQVFDGPELTGPTIMTVDDAGDYWLGTYKDALVLFRPGGRPEATPFVLPDGTSAYEVRAAFRGVEGDLWFGTNAKGLIRATRNLFTTYARDHGLSHDIITTVLVDRRGRAWVGTNCNGLNMLNAGRTTVRSTRWRGAPWDGPRGDPCIFAGTEAADGSMWFGTWGGGLTRLIEDRVERIWLAGGLRDSVVVALYTATDSTVWVGTDAGGLASLRDGRVTRVYTTADGLPHNSVRVISQGLDGAVWVGTRGGAGRLAPDGRWTVYSGADGLGASYVRAVHHDPDGVVWFGTYGGGLARLRDGRIGSVTRADGLGDDVVSTILDDGQGYLWMSGNRGVFRTPRDQLHAFLDGKLDRVHSVLYGVGDGLVNAETNGGFQPAAWRDVRGQLWFPTIHGVAIVDPVRATAEGRPPEVSIDAVVVDGALHEPTEQVVLEPGRPNLEFRYAGLSLSAPEHVTYRYRLRGFEDDWVEVGTRRTAHYPRLGPGRYVFEVAAANREGQWSTGSTTLGLRINPPMWHTWWFRVVVAVAVVGIGVAVGWRRVTAQRHDRATRAENARRLIAGQEQERGRLARELHDGLGQDLLVIKARTALLGKADGSPERSKALAEIEQIADGSLEAVRRLARNLRPYLLDHLGLSVAMREMVEGAAGGSGVRFEISIDNIDGLLSPEGEINLFRVVQEAVNNVLRHAQASAARVVVARSEKGLSVQVTDDGCGIERENGGLTVDGFGISSMAERARTMDAEFHIRSTPGAGTTIELTVPVGLARTSR